MSSIRALNGRQALLHCTVGVLTCRGARTPQHSIRRHAAIHRRQRRRGRDPQYLTGRGRPVLTTPVFWQVFYFFPSAELLDTASRCRFHLHHITPFWDEKFINFLWRGTAPPQTPPPSPPTAPRFSRLRRSTCDPPMFQWRWRPAAILDRRQSRRSAKLGDTWHSQAKFAGGRTPKPLIMDIFFFKTESAQDTHYIPLCVIISKFITFVIRQVC